MYSNLSLREDYREAFDLLDRDQLNIIVDGKAYWFEWGLYAEATQGQINQLDEYLQSQGLEKLD